MSFACQKEQQSNQRSFHEWFYCWKRDLVIERQMEVFDDKFTISRNVNRVKWNLYYL